MTDLADLAFDVAGDLPLAVRKVIGTALEHGWTLNPPGMTLALRLNHPTDDLAQPVYIVWAVGRTAAGRMSFRFSSCGTRGLIPLSGADLLEYLADPTVAYTTAEEAEVDQAAKAKDVPWDKHATPEANLMAQLGGKIIAIEADKAARAPRRTAADIVAEADAKRKAAQSAPKTAPLRIKIPGT